MWELIRTAIFAILLWGYVLIVSRVFESDVADNVRGVPFLVIILAVVAILMSYVSMNTRFGRYAYAIGGNREAARLSGINIKKSIFNIYITMGALVGLSGIAMAAYVGSGTRAPAAATSSTSSPVASSAAPPPSAAKAQSSGPSSAPSSCSPSATACRCSTSTQTSST